jgi:hypothetical protein
MALDEPVKRAGRVKPGQAADFLDGQVASISKQQTRPFEQHSIAPGPERHSGVRAHDVTQGVAMKMKAGRQTRQGTRRLNVELGAQAPEDIHVGIRHTILQYQEDVSLGTKGSPLCRQALSLP